MRMKDLPGNDRVRYLETVDPFFGIIYVLKSGRGFDDSESVSMEIKANKSQGKVNYSVLSNNYTLSLRDLPEATIDLKRKTGELGNLAGMYNSCLSVINELILKVTSKRANEKDEERYKLALKRADELESQIDVLCHELFDSGIEI